ncbi:unnamed protein product [Pseudo-nitzschia multistriata]|uniref:Uncharacterized protein n=1 Tax=Pseudo-nitzschia multistriata TaxID=183589 RepID=A0A448ZEK4_9STRA|nr:unnamed protein product [Pseudo-nitzschia multistriata]
MSTSNSSNNPTEVHRKIAFLGFRAVGKSSIVNSYVTGTFSETYDPTIESTYNKTIRFRRVSFSTDIVDTAGMDEFSRLSRNASLGVHGYALVFSIASRQSFEMIEQVNGALLNSLGDLPDVPRVLVGTKKDLKDSRQVSTADAQKLADTWGVPYIECSGKTGEKVAEVFHMLMKEVEADDGLLNEPASLVEAKSDSDEDSECSGFGFAALDLTGVNFDDDNDNDESSTLNLSEEDYEALKLERKLLMAQEDTLIENLIDSATQTDEKGESTCPSSSSSQWKRLLQLADLVTDGKYVDALKSDSSRWLLSVEEVDDKNGGGNYDNFFWDRVQQKLMKLQTVSECVEAEIIGIAAFNLFLQLNYTGPSLEDIQVGSSNEKKSDPLEGINPHACFGSYLQSSDEQGEKANLGITNKRDTNYHNSVLSELSVNGMWPCQVAEVPYLLLLARSIFSNLVPVSTESISLPKSWMTNDVASYKSVFKGRSAPEHFISITSKLTAAPLWSARAIVAHERLLLGDEPSERLWNEIETIFDQRCLVDFDAEDQEKFSETKKLKSMIYLEYGLASHYFEHAKKGKRLFDLAKETSGLTVEMTGSEGKRTKYQSTSTAQMIVRASSAKTPSDSARVDPSEESPTESNETDTKSKRIEHNEESHLLENIKYEDENDNRVSELNVLDQSIILALCLDVKNTNPADGLTGEEMGAYLSRVLHHHDDWIIYSTALLERAWLEFEGNHTKERAILQMQALADQHTNRLTITQSTRKSVEESSPVQERLRNLHSIVYPPRWQMLADIADRYASLGIVTTAAEIFTDIEYWDEAVECYRRAGKDSKAEEIVKERLSMNETPRMWMALGDLTNDPTHYEKAIELSRGRFSMAYIASETGMLH